MVGKLLIREGLGPIPEKFTTPASQKRRKNTHFLPKNPISPHKTPHFSVFWVIGESLKSVFAAD